MTVTQSRPIRVGLQLRPQHADYKSVGAGGPDYDLSELRSWIAWRDEVSA